MCHFAIYNGWKLLKVENMFIKISTIFMVLNCRCSYAAKLDIVANAAATAVAKPLQRSLKPSYFDHNCRCNSGSDRNLEL